MNRKVPEEEGRGQKLVKHVMSHILSQVDDIALLEFDAVDIDKNKDLNRRLQFNEERVNIILSFILISLVLWILYFSVSIFD